MIEKLNGILDECDLTELVVDVHGVGYAVTVPLSTFDRLPAVGEPVTLFTHYQLREDNVQLFGFATRGERSLFRLLIGTVTGVGPKLALNVLSCMTINGFCGAIVDGDVKTLAKISGIGKRTAERMIVELRDKVKKIGDDGNALDLVLKSTSGPSPSPAAADAVAALETLGIKKDPAAKVVQQLCDETRDNPLSAEQLIRKALAVLNS